MEKGLSKRILLVFIGSFFAVFAILPTLYGADSDRLVLKNPSFEVAAADGGPQAWSGSRKYYSISTQDARTGNACLKWEGHDRVYSLASQGTKMTGGDNVVFSVWVKTDKIKDGRATICMEWTLKNGKWGGGAYARGIDGTNKEWTRVSECATIPADAKSVSVTCYVTQGGTGTAWFDDVELATFVPPLFTAMTTDLYRQQSDGGPVNVFVGYNKTGKDVDVQKFKPVLSLLDAADKTVATWNAAEIASDHFKFHFDSKPLACGTYKLSCSMANPASGERESVSLSFTRLEKFPERVSYIDSHRRLIHNGKPFFPLGLYMGDAPEADVERIGQSAFNCIMPYHPIDRKTLDNLHGHGIKVIYSVKDNFAGLRVKTPEEGDRLTEKMVGEFKDHPAVLAWYINDELPKTMLDRLSARRDQMEKLDPGRPTWVVLYQVGELRYHLPTYDVIGTDPYPIPSSAARAAEWGRKTFDSAFGCRAVWQVPQIFNWASYKKTEVEKKSNRAPTYEEMRGMAWMSIATGANGLVFYSYFDLKKMDKTVKEGGQALVREPFDTRWGEVKRFAAEIAAQFPILLSAGQTLAIEPADDSASDVVHRLYGTDNGTWLLVVNTSGEPKTATFTIPQGAKPGETRLGGVVKADAARLTVSLKKFEPALVLVK